MTSPSRFKATARRRTHLLVSLITTPTDGWLALRMVGWRAVLPLLKRRLSLGRLVRLMHAGGKSHSPPEELQARIAELARVVYRSQHFSRRGNCLERSLVMYRYLSAAGADPELVVGMRRGEDALRGHAWVSVHGNPIEEPPDSLEGLVQIVAFGGDGSGPGPVGYRPSRVGRGDR
jgi:hypothetical protein